MRKEEVRKEFFKLKLKGHSYAQCRKMLLAINGFDELYGHLSDGIKGLRKSIGI